MNPDPDAKLIKGGIRMDKKNNVYEVVGIKISSQRRAFIVATSAIEAIGKFDKKYPEYEVHTLSIKYGMIVIV
jgi:hypothetical protein